jgi:hypothetical protein
MSGRAPEQQVVDYLEAAGYRPDSIIRYLEAQVAREWASADFAECGPGEKMTFGVCRKIGEAPAAQPAQQGATPAQPRAQQPGQRAAGQQPKPKEAQKSGMEEKLEKAAKAQGSDATNNRKVVIDGKAYGWAIQNGKPIMVEWGAVAGIKKVGPKQAKPKRGGRRGGAGGDNAGRIAGLKKALEKQVNEAGRQAILKQIQELGG